MVVGHYHLAEIVCFNLFAADNEGNFYFLAANLGQGGLAGGAGA